LATFLEVAAATGARRGEVLALRWSDIQDGRAIITRSLTQTRQVLEFKGTKTQEFPQNFGALVANPFAFSVLLFAKSGIARYGSIGPETSLTY
jgi:hypothetical protein